MEITERGEKSLGDLKRAFANPPENGSEDSPHPKEPIGGWSDGLGSHATNPKEPRTNGWPITYGGDRYIVSSCERRLAAQFEVKVRADALKAISEIRELLGPEEADNALHVFVTDRAKGFYNFDGKYCLSSLMELPGAMYFLFLLLRRCHSDITEEEARNLFLIERPQCLVAVKWALGNWMRSNPDGKSSGTGSPSEEAMLKRTEEIWEAAQRGEKTTPMDLNR